MKNWQPHDAIAGLLVIGCIILKCMGHDSILSWVLLGIVAAYYGIDLTPFIKLGRHQKPDSTS